MQWPGSETTQNLFIDQDQNEDSIDWRQNQDLLIEASPWSILPTLCG
jgi:hypothetical protein